MSRYIGPRLKVMRALGVELHGLSRKVPDRRPYPPGQHGASKRRRESIFGLQLREKQKLKTNYGLTERQMRRLLKRARRSKTATGERILELLESRLDNAVFRVGFSPTIPAARQLINHGHIEVNGRKVDIASFTLSAGDVISVREKSRKLEIIMDIMMNPTPYLLPDWAELDTENFQATVKTSPGADSVTLNIDVQQVIEYYASRI